MIYDTYKFLKPPRPITAIPPHRLVNYEGRGWIAQAKLNGTYNIVTVTPNGQLLAATRDGQVHKQWEFDKDSAKAFKDLPGKANNEAVVSNDLQENGLKSSIGDLQESLDYLRLSVKYLVFDLEATRRENAYLRRLVEQANRERNGRAESDQEPENGFE